MGIISKSDIRGDIRLYKQNYIIISIIKLVK